MAMGEYHRVNMVGEPLSHSHHRKKRMKQRHYQIVTDIAHIAQLTVDRGSVDAWVTGESRSVRAFEGAGVVGEVGNFDGALVVEGA